MHPAHIKSFFWRPLAIHVLAGAGEKNKREKIFDYYRINADLLIMCESHSCVDEEKIWRNEWGGEIIFSHGERNSRGVAVLMTKQMYNQSKNIEVDKEGRYVIFDLESNLQNISIAAIYAPNKDTPDYFCKINKLLENRSEHKIIIGDFNLTLDVEMDRLNTYCNNNKAKDEVENIMDHYSLREVWRTQNEEKREYSWIKRGTELKASRIDYALVSSGLDQKAKSCMYIPGIQSDHRAIYLLIDMDSSERGCGYWKFNNILLQNQEFLETMNIEIDKTMNLTQDDNPLIRWEKLKKRIKKITIEFSRKKTSEEKIVIANLSEKVNEYETRLPLNKNEDELLQKTKVDLEENLLERVKGLIFRSKVRWHEQGEKNTKYFYSLEKARYNAKTCYTLITEQGKEIIDQQDILAEQRKYYAKLYSEDKDVNFNLKNTKGIKVPEEIRKEQENQITIEELQVAVKTMNNDKTPGEDGIPADFYKVFWSKIKKPFFEMMIEAYEGRNLHQTARQGILNLIPKPKKDSRLIKNLRPITLLNVDYKIVEKAIANKMIPALKHIIHTDQRGFMKDRRISVNIRKMLDIMHTTKEEDLEAVVLSLDFVKCFDKCSFSILHGSLEFFDFGNIIKEWTKILYKDFTVKIQNNGHFSKAIEINKGVHQGGCCSSIYFLVIAEILAIAIRDNEDIEGITIEQIRNILNQFADDMDIFSKCTERSLKAILNELQSFYYQSGFEVSYEKTTLYRIGSLRHSNAQMYDLAQFKWSNEDICVLGVTITHEDINDKNYNDIQIKVKKVLNAWYNRGLTLMGKIQVVNTLVASLFVYKMMVLPSLNDYLIKKIDNVIREFLWNGKKSKIAYSILQNEKEQGGLNLVNLKNKEISLKATWPQILEQETEYAKIVYKIMRVSCLQDDIWRCRIKPEDVPSMKIRNTFWMNVLQAWSHFNAYKNYREENQVIWYNSDIKVNKKMVMWKDAHNRGLIYVYQLFDEMKFKSYEQVWEEFGLTKLRYNSLKSAIPTALRIFFQNNQRSQYMPIPPHNHDIYRDHKGLSRIIYKWINGELLLIHNKYLKWITEIGYDAFGSLYDYGLNHKEIYRTTNIPKYRNFQYRLIQRGLVTNIQLYKWNLSTTQLCQFCLQSKETIIHLIIECPQIQSFWQEVFEYISINYGSSNLDTTTTAILLNHICNRKGHISNCICLIAKQYIYRQKWQQGTPQMHEFKGIVQHIERMEKYIAQKNRKMGKHLQKWKGIGDENAEGERLS